MCCVFCDINRVFSAYCRRFSCTDNSQGPIPCSSLACARSSRRRPTRPAWSWTSGAPTLCSLQPGFFFASHEYLKVAVWTCGAIILSPFRAFVSDISGAASLLAAWSSSFARRTCPVFFRRQTSRQQTQRKAFFIAITSPSSLSSRRDRWGGAARFELAAELNGLLKGVLGTRLKARNLLFVSFSSDPLLGSSSPRS